MNDLIGLETGRYTREDGKVIVSHMKPGFATKIVGAIDKSRVRGMERLLTALGIEHIGAYYAEQLTKKCESIDELACKSEDELRKKLEPDSRKTDRSISKRIHDYLNSPEGREAIKTAEEGIDVGEWLLKQKIHHVLANRCGKVGRRFKNVHAFGTATKDEIYDAIKEESATVSSLHRFFHSDSGRSIVQSLKKVGVRMTAERYGGREGAEPLAGKTVVVTGALESFSRKEAEEAIKAAGGRTTNSISKSTSFVVVGEDPGGKLNEARRLGIEIVNEEEFLRRLDKNKGEKKKGLS